MPNQAPFPSPDQRRSVGWGAPLGPWGWLVLLMGCSSTTEAPVELQPREVAQTPLAQPVAAPEEADVEPELDPEPAAQPSSAPSSSESEPARGEAGADQDQTDAPEPEAPSATTPPQDQEPLGEVQDASASAYEALRERAREAFEAGDYASARAALDQLEAGPRVDRARTHLLAGDLDAALEVAREAHARAPGHAGATLLYGTCLAARAQRDDADGDLDTALEVLLAAPRSRSAVLAASRVARELGQADQALELARLALRLEGEDAAALDATYAPGPSEVAERTFAEAALAAWRARGALGSPEAWPLFEEARDALRKLAVRSPRAPAPWSALAAAELEAERPLAARAALERGLAIAPEDEGLLALYAEAGRSLGGLAGLVDAFEDLQRERPEVGAAWWIPAEALFQRALDGGPGTRNRFLAAERGFKSCRERDSSRREACLRREVLARTGQGWSFLAAGDIDAARGMFAASAELHPDALDEHLDTRIPSAAEGLVAVVESLLRADRVQVAAPLAERLHLRRRDDALLARLAGDANRDLGDRYQLDALDYERAARGSLRSGSRLTELREAAGIGPGLFGTGREVDELRRAAARHEVLANERWAAAFRAYVRRVKLAPDDLRARCDAGSLALGRLGVELEWTRATLEECVTLCLAELEQGGSQGEERLALEDLAGDACKLLGILHLEHLEDPRSARAWFERCLEVDSVPRADVVDHYLPRCEGR